MDGYYKSGSSCLPCNYKCETCDNGSTCLSCKSGVGRLDNAPTCGCGDDYYDDNSNINCILCESPCVTCTA